MSDAIVKNAVDALRASLDSEIAQISRQIEGLNVRHKKLMEMRTAVERLAAMSQEGAGSEFFQFAPPTSEPNQNEETSGPTRRAANNSTKEDVARETRRLIEERGAPISRPELLKILTNEGFKIEGSNPLTVLSTMLWRTRDQEGLLHLRGHGYWLSERPLPEADYLPELAINSTQADQSD